MNIHESYMQRALELAALGLGQVAPNPLVGAVLVYEDLIIGEGYHQQFGGPHAEVNCIAAVNENDKTLIPESTLYVTLEPCCHHGKTPPCTSLIISKGIKKVVVASKDPFEKVNGTGFKILQEAGVAVEYGILEAAACHLNRRFFHFHQKKRPYIILKWAATEDGYMAGEQGLPVKISNTLTDQLVHRWRSEEQAIFAGTQTILNDNPRLTNRHWPGKNPIRITIDRQLRIPQHYHLFDRLSQTVIFNEKMNNQSNGVHFVQIAKGADLHETLVHYSNQHGIQSILVEGGSQILDYFLSNDLWDEIRLITAKGMELGGGIPAPKHEFVRFDETMSLQNDIITTAYRRYK